MSTDSIGPPPAKHQPCRKRVLPPEVAEVALIVKVAAWPCVYFLLSRERVVYVGSSKFGSKRVVQHFDRIPFDTVAFLSVHEAERAEVERRYIRQLNPKYNTVHTPRGRSRKKRGPNSFPLHLRANGQWCKKHKGRSYYFGSCRDEALLRYRLEWLAITSGQPRPLPTRIAGVKLTPASYQRP